MILRKPYAFLIKHFKIIHLIIALLMCFLMYKSYNIVDFLNRTVSNNYMAAETGEIAGIYINYFMLIADILVLGLLIAIYYLLSHKKKPRKFYAYSLVGYVVLFLLFSYFYSYIDKLAMGEALSSSSIRANRDIAIIMLLPQVIFIVYMLVTSIGFNIKKFNFGEDLKELEISDEDNEEFEISVGKNNYLIKRKIRKKIRELRYYILENKFIFTMIVIILVIILGTSIFLNREVYDSDYDMSDKISHNKFMVSVQDSIISPLSYRGETIKDGYYYLAVKLNVSNNGFSSEKLDYSNFVVEGNGKKYKPVLTDSLYFKDFAIPYYGNPINKSESKNIVLAYEIPKNEILDTYSLKMYRGSSITPGEIIAKYSEIQLYPVLVEETADSNLVYLDEDLEFVYSNIGDTIFKVKNFLLTKSYQFSYELCNNTGDCRTLTDAVSVDYNISGDCRLLLVLDYDYKLDSESDYSKVDASIKEFVNNFMKVRYVIDGKEYYSVLYYRSVKNLDDKLVLQVDTDMSKASNIDVIFSVRNKNFIINLK